VPGNNNDVQHPVVQGPLTAFQLGAIAVCIGLNMLDGFDILAMSFSASGVKAAWGLQNSQLGALLSAGLVGMALGSLFLAPCADRWGRRRIVLLSGTIAGIGMSGSTAARGFADLLALRALTGIGIGGTIASVAVVVSEYAPDRWRSAALAAYATGYPVGATIGGALTALAIPRYGWRSAFAIGGAMSLVLLLVAWRRLPESVDFLVTRRPPGALGRLNALLDLADRIQVIAHPRTIADIEFAVQAGRQFPHVIEQAARRVQNGLAFLLRIALAEHPVEHLPRIAFHRQRLTRCSE